MCVNVKEAGSECVFRGMSVSVFIGGCRRMSVCSPVCTCRTVSTCTCLFVYVNSWYFANL